MAIYIAPPMNIHRISFFRPWILLLPLIVLTACTSAPTPMALSGPIDTRISERDNMVQVYIPAGRFLMGSTRADIDTVMEACSYCLLEWFDHEMPQHKVYLDAFWIDQTEVTNAMFAQFVAETGYQTDAERIGAGIDFRLSTYDWAMTKGANWRHPHGPTSNIDDMENHPVVQMSGNDAEAYCTWAGRRLPTEAEWEKAARGTDGRSYPWGNEPPAGNLLNFADRNLNANESDNSIDDGYVFTAPVGSYPDGASPYGVFDMAGNVWERVIDWYSDTYYANSPARNPAGPASSEYHIIRGGSWSRMARYVRTASRYRYRQLNRSSGLGFRCASTP
ncbi:MAG: formylglycine-generating enzyme family protein [Chloroflexota bacterium]